MPGLFLCYMEQNKSGTFAGIYRAEGGTFPAFFYCTI